MTSGNINNVIVIINYDTDIVMAQCVSVNAMVVDSPHFHSGEGFFSFGKELRYATRNFSQIGRIVPSSASLLYKDTRKLFKIPLR